MHYSSDVHVMSIWSSLHMCELTFLDYLLQFIISFVAEILDCSCFS